MKDGKFVITFPGTKYINKSGSSSCGDEVKKVVEIQMILIDLQ